MQNFSFAVGDTHRVQVTLAWAQTLNGMLAARSDAPLLLSNAESMRFTHRLRSVHDGMLVGVGTVLSDDPLLSVRLVPVTPDTDHQGETAANLTYGQPRPIILDTKLKIPLDCRLLTERVPCRLMPIVCCGVESLTSASKKVKQMEQLGCLVLGLECNNGDRHPDLSFVLETLYQRGGIRRLMVEGGPRVLLRFLESSLVDRVVITISPTFVKPHLDCGLMLTDKLTLTDVHYHQSQEDMTIIARYPPSTF